MNQNNCEIARDLMPLSVDGVCSEGSQRFLDGHLAECKPCQEYFSGMKAGMLNIKMEPTQEAKSLKKSLRHMGKRFKALWITLIALVCAFVVLLAIGGVQQMRWNWTADLPLDMYTTAINGTNPYVSIIASFPFLKQHFNGQRLDLQPATGQNNHTGQPDAVILTYTLNYLPYQAQDWIDRDPTPSSSLPVTAFKSSGQVTQPVSPTEADSRYTTGLNSFDLCHDGYNIYLVDGMDSVTLTDDSHLILLDTGLPVSEIRVQCKDDVKVIYTWGDSFHLSTPEIHANGIPASKIMLRKDYEAWQNTQ